MRGWCVLILLLAACLPVHAQEVPDEMRLDAPGVSDTPMRIRVLLPPGYADGSTRYPVLYMNDGQDLEAVGVQATLQQLSAAGAIEPLIVVAIDMPPDRMAGYGLFDRSARHSMPAQTKYGPVGSNAWAYAQWVTDVLVPDIDARYRTRPRADQRALLGWSLGALSAFGIGWQYPQVFGRIGAFSPSLWVSVDRSSFQAINDTRLTHRLVDSGPRGGYPKVFMAVGTAEETSDRDADGIVDVVDDARDLLDGWQASDGTHRQGLRQLVNPERQDGTTSVSADDASLWLLEGGKHNQASWARMMPHFLEWAYGAGVKAAAVDPGHLQAPAIKDAQ